jgi:hypothetical protein
MDHACEALGRLLRTVIPLRDPRVAHRRRDVASPPAVGGPGPRVIDGILRVVSRGISTRQSIRRVSPVAQAADRWDFETPAESQIPAEPAGSNSITPYRTRFESGDLQVFRRAHGKSATP